MSLQRPLLVSSHTARECSGGVSCMCTVLLPPTLQMDPRDALVPPTVSYSVINWRLSSVGTWLTKLAQPVWQKNSKPIVFDKKFQRGNKSTIIFFWNFQNFYPHDAMLASADGLSCGIVSVCLSVCLSQVRVLSKRLNESS